MLMFSVELTLAWGGGQDARNQQECSGEASPTSPRSPLQTRGFGGGSTRFWSFGEANIYLLRQTEQQVLLLFPPALCVRRKLARGLLLNTHWAPGREPPAPPPSWWGHRHRLCDVMRVMARYVKLISWMLTRGLAVNLIRGNFSAKKKKRRGSGILESSHYKMVTKSDQGRRRKVMAREKGTA